MNIDIDPQTELALASIMADRVCTQIYDDIIAGYCQDIISHMRGNCKTGDRCEDYSRLARSGFYIIT